MKSSRALAAAVALSVLIQVHSSAQAAAPGAPAALALVRYIYHGLTVIPPGKGTQQARVKMALFQQYGVRTTHTEKASIGFRDGTVVHINSDTDAVLADPHTTHINTGEIAQYLVPGTNHRVRTASAAAVANGTTFDVQVDSSGLSTFTVLHGALLVTNDEGTVVVKSGHQSIVPQHKAPGNPTTVDAATLTAVFDWTDGIPTPDLGEDVVLDANRGTIQGYSSQNDAARWHVEHISDGLLSQGWETADGQVRNQYVKFGFQDSNTYRISGIVIDPAATGGDTSDADLKDFEIRTSSTGTRDTDFTTIFHGTCLRNASPQRFRFPVAVRARYIELVALNNYGNPQRLAVAEFEAVATTSLFAAPEGLAIDGQGNIYVADQYSNHIQKLSPNGKSLAVWGSKGQQRGQFLDPTGVALDGKGNVYVADTANHRIQKLSPKGKPLAVWGDINTFFQPSGVAVDRDGNIFVADTFNNRIKKLSPNGTLLATWTDPGFNFPNGVTVDSHGHVYVSDQVNDRVVKLSASGSVIAIWGKLGGSPGQFIFPSAVAVDAHDNLYVSDTINSRIQKLSPTGRVRAVWGRYATIPQVLGQPAGLAVDSSGNVYITDEQNHRIQVRAPDGSVKSVLGYFGISRFEHTSALGQFNRPHGIALDGHGNIYVADTFNQRIQVLTDAGPVAAFGVRGTGPGQLNYPYGVAVDSAGNVYVADQDNQRVDKFSSAGAFIASWGSKGSGPGQFTDPDGITIGPDGNVYVADHGNNRVEKFTPEGQYLAAFGSQAQGLFGADSVAVDKNGNIWVAAVDIVEISPTNQVLADWSLPGPLAAATSIAVDQAGNVYAGDFFNKRVVKFSPDGTIVDVWN